MSPPSPSLTLAMLSQLTRYDTQFQKTMTSNNEMQQSSKITLLLTQSRRQLLRNESADALIEQAETLIDQFEDDIRDAKYHSKRGKEQQQGGIRSKEMALQTFKMQLSAVKELQDFSMPNNEPEPPRQAARIQEPLQPIMRQVTPTKPSLVPSIRPKVHPSSPNSVTTFEDGIEIYHIPPTLR